jgi:hypothetical protein
LVNGSTDREGRQAIWIALLAIAVLVALAALAIGPGKAGLRIRAIRNRWEYRNSEWEPWPTPASLSELVSGPRQDVATRIIAIGVIAGLHATGQVDDARCSPATYAPTKTDAQLFCESRPYYSEWQLKVERVLLGDKPLAPGMSLMITTSALPGYSIPYNPVEVVGERYMYFLALAQNCESCPLFLYSPWGPNGRLKIDGSEVTYTDDMQSPVEFARGTPAADFVSAVATEVAVQHGTRTP